eukprot:134493_1
MTRFFQSVSTNIIIPICVITIVQSQPSKRVVLTSQSTETDGAHVAIIGASGEVTSSSTSWDITSLNPETWHLEVNLDNSWGFDPNYESNITLEIDGTDLVQNTIFAFSNPTLDRFIITRIRSSQFHANTIYTSVETRGLRVTSSVKVEFRGLNTSVSNNFLTN